MESLLLDEGWNPAGGLVELDEAILDICHFDEPAVKAAVHKWCLTTPAVGITMLDGTVGEELSSSFQIGNHHLVSVLDVNAGVRFNDGQELSILIDRNRGLAWLN